MDCGAWVRTSSSTRKVDRPAMIASFAPTRVKIRSTGESEQHSAATQQPNCAISTVRQACARSKMWRWAKEGLAGLPSPGKRSCGLVTR